ncbi:hypothetical protein RRG08_023789 [Elysia crispata]|uniref:Uncharacterized protein n=1 Tax=Elysia crispata TaxID=231223 RepID=A0AAE0ZW38_9GAST|nr:hypothetical protein RRG08_023789 [Elysia crispata]
MKRSYSGRIRQDDQTIFHLCFMPVVTLHVSHKNIIIKELPFGSAKLCFNGIFHPSNLRRDAPLSRLCFSFCTIRADTRRKERLMGF